MVDEHQLFEACALVTGNITPVLYKREAGRRDVEQLKAV